MKLFESASTAVYISRANQILVVQIAMVRRHRDWLQLNHLVAIIERKKDHDTNLHPFLLKLRDIRS